MPFKALLQSLLITSLLALLPLVVAGQASFLGTDVSQVALGIVTFYPWTAAGEVAKIFASAWLLIFLTIVVTSTAAASFSRRWTRWLAYPFAPLIAYAMWLGATVLTYPALFETHLSEKVSLGVFRASYHVSPNALNMAALALLLAPTAAGLWRRRRCLRRRSVAGAGEARGIAQLAGLGVIAACGGWWMHAHRARALEERRSAPGVLLIGVDSLRADRVARTDLTPALAELAALPETVTFADHWVGVPRTFPSWLEILQGRYAPRTGIRHMFPGFAARRDEFAGIVTAARDAGWRTVAVSDFAGDIFPRFRAGFDVVEAPKLTLQTLIRMSADQVFPAFLPLITSDLGVRIFPALKESPAFADPRQLTDRVVDHLTADGPSFVTAFYSTAHFPYASPYPYYSLFARKDYRGPFRFQKNPDLSTAAAAGDPSEVEQVRALYDGAVRSVDDELGRLFAALKARGLWDDMIVVVTSDHGEDLFESGRLQGHGEHLRGEHVLKVPLLVKMPRRTPPSRRLIEFATRSIDLAPTLAGLLSLSAPPDAEGRGFDGTDLTPWLLEPSRAAPELPVYSETGIWFARGGAGFFQERRLDYPGIAGLLVFDQGYSGEIVLNPNYEQMIVAAKHRSLIVGDYKAIYMPTPAGVVWELYDRRVDPLSERDLAAERPEAMEMMRQRLLAFVEGEERDYRIAAGSGFVVPR